jgi:hypothetical protein
VDVGNDERVGTRLQAREWACAGELAQRRARGHEVTSSRVDVGNDEREGVRL